MDIGTLATTNIVVLIVVGVVVWGTRKWWSEWIAQQVRGDVEERLERLRFELRQSESEIGVLRDSALSNLKTTQAALTQRRMKAVDDLWAGVDQWSQFNGTLMTMALLRSDAFLESLEQGDRDSIHFAEEMLKAAPTDIEGVGSIARSARPYVSELAWVSILRIFRFSQAQP